jgi:hypothetical protein
MARFFCFLMLLLAGLQAQAQEIPVQKEDRSSYTFTVPAFIVLTDFEILSAVPHEKENEYLVQVRALNSQKQTDASIRGNIVFEINGKAQPVKFIDGLGRVVVNLQDQDELVMKDLDSGIVRKGKITKPVRWYGLLMLIPGVLVLWLIVSRVLRRRKQKDGL